MKVAPRQPTFAQLRILGVLCIGLAQLCCSSGCNDAEDPSRDCSVDAEDGGTDSEMSLDGDVHPGDAETQPDVGEAPALACPTKGGEMIVIPAGPFLFGQGKMEVNIPRPYCIDRTEVTVAAWNRCVADGACTGYDDWERCQAPDPTRSPNQCFPDRDDYPANFVDWFRAESFCRWAGKRLAFGAEWEKAARGTDGRNYPWGDDFHCRYAHTNRGTVYRECRGYLALSNYSVPVGTYPRGVSPYGALDMVGNVEEWIEYRTDRTVPPLESEPGITRGGSFLEGDLTVTAFGGDAMLGPGIMTIGHGIRCAWSPPEED